MILLTIKSFIIKNGVVFLNKQLVKKSRNKNKRLEKSKEEMMPKKVKTPKWRKKVKEVEKDLKNKIKLFGRMSDECLTCGDFFDKTNVEAVRSWHVVVRKGQESVNLYCPECFKRAQQLIQDIQRNFDKQKENT